MNNCDFYKQTKEIEYHHGKSETDCFLIECDGRFHNYRNSNKYPFYAFVTKCPVWIAQLKGEKIDAIFPISNGVKDKTFENYDPKFNNHFSEVKDCQLFINGTELVLMFTGESRRGKTHLAMATLNQAREIGKATAHTNIIELEKVFFNLKQYNTIIYNQGAEQHKINKAVYILLIDELGKMNPKFIDDFQELLDYRLLEKKKTIFTTNMNDASLVNALGEKIFNRLSGNRKNILLKGNPYKRS